MNANLKLIVPAVLAAVALSACGSLGGKFGGKGKKAEEKAAQVQEAPAAPPAPQTIKVDSIDATKEVAYKCGADGKDPLNVMYGMKNNEVVVAQVKYKNQLTPHLHRVAGETNGQNAFWGGNIAWVAEGAKASNVDKVDGNMLTLRGPTEVNGTQQIVDQIITKYCKLDKAATAKLKAAAAKAAKAKK